MFKTPILFLIFNRPELTKKVFEKIREVRPTYLYVAADGPRFDYPDDKQLCSLSRQIVEEGIDWPCEVKYLFRNENLGCGLAISGAISWFFNQVEHGIILEDDCLPNSSFFSFCEEMLVKYAHAENIGAISGTNFFNSISTGNSYAFSYYGGNWGWATWRRAWLQFDLDVLNLAYHPTREFYFLDNRFKNKNQVLGLKNLFRSVISNQNLVNSTWDFQWFFIRLKNNLISIVPSVNLITNIGLDGGTHFKKEESINNKNKYYSKTSEIVTPLNHPFSIEIDEHLDDCFGKLYDWIPAKEIPKVIRKNPFGLESIFKYIYNIIKITKT
jgi:hypothetical protein